MKRLLKLFMIFWTAFILAYASTFVVFEKEQIRRLHERIAPLQYVGVMLGVFDDSYLDDENLSMRERLKQNLRAYVNRRETGNQGVNAKTTLLIENYEETMRLYSPVHTFAGVVGDTVTEMRITLSHRGRELVRTMPISPRSDGYWSIEVGLANEMMFAGENTYLIEALFAGGTREARRVTITTDFQRVEIGDTVLYVDPHYIPEGQTEDIIRTALDLQEQETNFITRGCDEQDKQPSLLLQHDVQFREISACATFSLIDEYLLRFEPNGVSQEDYLYAIHAPGVGRIHDVFPLYRKHLGQIYYTLVFYDQPNDRLETIYAEGTSSHYTMRIERYSLTKQDTILQIVVTDGNQLVIENERQRMFTYLYKEWNRTTGLSFPGHRYQYFIRNYAGNRTKINEGPLYTLPIAVFAPRKEYDSTFTFRITLDGDMLYIDDSIKITEFNVTAMGTTIDVKDRPHRLNDPAVCKNTTTHIYKTLLGDEFINLSYRDHPYIVGEGRDVSSVKIFHNGKTTGSIPDQLFKGYLYHRLGTDRGNLHRGENTYTIKGYDAWGNELCSVTIDQFAD